jgi:Bacterial regulatory proteins, luxR family
MITNNPARLGTPDEDGEREVLRLAGELLSTDEIAGKLLIAVNTVKSHLKSSFRKARVSWPARRGTPGPGNRNALSARSPARYKARTPSPGHAHHQAARPDQPWRSAPAATTTLAHLIVGACMRTDTPRQARSGR